LVAADHQQRSANSSERLRLPRIVGRLISPWRDRDHGLYFFTKMRSVFRTLPGPILEIASGNNIRRHRFLAQSRARADERAITTHGVSDDRDACIVDDPV